MCTAVSKAEEGKDEGGWGVGLTRWTLEPPEVPPGCPLHGLHVPRTSLWESGRGPSSHWAAPSGGRGRGPPRWPPRREGKDQLSVMRVGTGYGDGMVGGGGEAHMGPRKLQPFPGVCGLWAVAGPIVLWKGEAGPMAGSAAGRQAVCTQSWGGKGGRGGRRGGAYRKGD